MEDLIWEEIKDSNFENLTQDEQEKIVMEKLAMLIIHMQNKDKLSEE